ncbi:SpoVA/SpoVAEb family sporulation membrane protein [Peribacillus simplex]|uniref:Stage V sporulation protein AC n=1 Tax=Peribacillus simplex NBRC 15720 = DSM 1321 TaxID=1349754 RepID=A0A223EPZ9_9BACI|nr:SpoVA/SpoVAEb family sporulation membrane protein [Peribacillus simplex]ASS97334.1 hypothetical protein BS1321_09995 [Peribacillus simplex NBRC 15720 = DSM 1321]MEC1397101.1 SpoVA/SpoVAEb family sporulation membrane protein [Peribacillus simplex]
MLNDTKKKLTPIQQEHQQVQTQLEIKMSVMTGCIIYTIGQVIPNFHILYHDFTDLTAGNPMAGILIFIAMHRIWMYDRIGRFVPLTGFGNAAISAAIEYRAEGFVLGDGCNIFKLAESFMLFLGFITTLVMTILIQWGVYNAYGASHMGV